MAEPRLFDQSSLKPRLEQAFDFAARQVRLTVERTPDYFPIYTVGGRWLHRGELWTDWCGGFHAGMMWLIANRTGESWWRRTAEHYSGLLEHRQHDHNVHDLGFLFLNTYLPWYRATGDERLQAVLITAGRTLALRYNPRGRFLNSFIGPESLCVWGVASGSAASHPDPGSSGMVEISEESRKIHPFFLARRRPTVDHSVAAGGAVARSLSGTSDHDGSRAQISLSTRAIDDSTSAPDKLCADSSRSSRAGQVQAFR